MFVRLERPVNNFPMMTLLTLFCFLECIERCKKLRSGYRLGFMLSLERIFTTPEVCEYFMAF